MNLGKKKSLAAKALEVGEKRIVFLKPRLDDIKEAITKQDMKDLEKEHAILIKAVKGRAKVVKRKRKRNVGKIKKKLDTRKKDYIVMTRKLRKHVAGLKKSGELNRDEAKNIRNRIKNKAFRSKAHLKEHVGVMKK